MNLYLAVLRFRVPVFVKKKMLRELFRITAAAFDCPVPRTEGLSHAALLEEFARFTAGEGEKAVRGSRDLEDIRRRLYASAYRMGAELKRRLRIRDTKEVLLMSRILYNVLGIEFRGEESGEVTIGRCFFSAYYSPGACRILSSLDEGIAAGLSGGGTLTFSRRITEGSSCCTARLSPAQGAARDAKR